MFIPEGLTKKLYFGIEDAADFYGIKSESARVLCSRYVKKGIFIRVKNNFYVLRQNWKTYLRNEFLKIANFLQVPSYISLSTALEEYQATTQVQRDYYESIALKRSVRFSSMGAAFNFYKFKKDYYFGFEKRKGVFLAVKEKALVDAVYLYSFGKYKIDFSSLDLKSFDRNKLLKIIKVFPLKTQKIIGELCKI